MDPKGLPNGGLPPGCPPPTPGSVLPGPLYGMVFFNGVMTFRQLDEIANNMTCPQYVKLTPDAPAPPQPTDARSELERPNAPKPESNLEGPGGLKPESKPEAPDLKPEGLSPIPPPPSPSPGESAAAWPTNPSPSPKADETLARASTSPSTPGGKVKIPPPRVWDAATDKH
jgi:hypothetical protein